MSEANFSNLYEELQAAQQRAEKAEECCNFLAQVSTLLAEASDATSTLRNVAIAATPFLADYCLIHWFEPDGTLQEFTAYHCDRDRQSLVESLAPFYSTFLENLDCLVAQTLRSQSAYIGSTISSDFTRTFLPNSQSQDLLDQLAPCSVLLLPLVTHGRCFGLLTLAMSNSNRHYSDLEISTAHDLALWTALAIYNARLCDKAEETNRLKQEFLATVSHELRTPLHAILGWTHILRTRKINEATTELAIETIDRKANDQLRLIYDLLDVSRIFAGKLRLKSELVDLETTIYEAIAQLRLAAQSKSIQVNVQIDQVSSVVGDQKYLRQVIWNLLSNAIKFTPNNGQVTIELTQQNQIAQIRVRDTGEGIEPDFLPHVFDRFRQADGSLTRSHGGLGLGLALVYYLVELHGGTAEVESPGKGMGTTFTIQLPIPPLPCVAAQNAAPLSSELQNSPPQRRLENMCLMVLEPESTQREWLTMYLEEEGAAVIAVSSVRKALSFLNQQSIAGLICAIGIDEQLDIQLTAGLQRWQREHNRVVPAIALLPIECSSTSSCYQISISPMFQNSLSKPIEPEELIAVVTSVVARSSTAISERKE